MAAGADVVVVGGGIIGCATAHELARRGAHVTLFEKDELAAGASGRNHGLLLTPLDPVLVPMAEATTELYEQFAPDAQLPLGLDPEPIGFLIAAGGSEAERAAGRTEAEAAASCGVKVEQLDPRELKALEPALADDLVEGWLLHNGRRLHPANLTSAFGLAARSHGADIHTHARVRTLITRGPAVRGVITDEGPLTADTVVLAAGPWSAELTRGLAISLPVVGARGWLVSLAAHPAPIHRLVERAGWHEPPQAIGVSAPRAADVAGSRPEAVVGTLLQPNLDGTLMVGGSRQVALTSEPEDPEVPRKMLREAIRLLPALARGQVLSAWWGLRPMTPDGRPIVGWLREGLLVAAGHGSIGVILAGGTAKLAASMVLGESSPLDPGPFEPGRFKLKKGQAE